jgi:hypothetical protein
MKLRGEGEDDRWTQGQNGPFTLLLAKQIYFIRCACVTDQEVFFQCAVY